MISSRALASSLAREPSSEPWRVVTDDTVVTRNRDGSARSLFKDSAWIIEAYGVNSPGRSINFKIPASSSVAQSSLAAISVIQIKQVMYVLMHLATDDMPAVSTLRANATRLREYSRFALLHQKTLYEAMEDTTVVLAYIRQKGYAAKGQRLHAILAHLHRTGSAKTGVKIPFQKLHAPMLERFRDRTPNTQHPVIPTRVYQHFLAHCETELTLMEKAGDDLVLLMRQLYSGKPVPTAIQPSVTAVLMHFGRPLWVRSIAGAVGEIAVLCQTIVQAFTGMRIQESKNLPFNCLKVFRKNGLEHYAIEGITTKLTGGRAKRAYWVTSYLGARAVRLVQKLLGEAHAQFSNAEYQSSTSGKYLLFCATGLWVKSYELGRGMTKNGAYVEAFRQRAFPSIIAADIAELKLIDPFRAWDDEPKFAVGELWPFTGHQLRRTLALYAQRSGLVSLPSLKRQLQHLTLEMSMYYAQGSAFARDLLANNKDHFAKEWAASQGLSQYLAYAKQVLFSDERLFGGHAAWVSSPAVKQSPVSVYSRAETLQMFERGQLAYKETVLGGCVSTEPCGSSPLNWLRLDCLESNCRHLVLIPSKLRRVIKAQEKRVNALEKAVDSVEYRMEHDALTALRAAEAKVASQENS